MNIMNVLAAMVFRHQDPNKDKSSVSVYPRFSGVWVVDFSNVSCHFILDTASVIFVCYGRSNTSAGDVAEGSEVLWMRDEYWGEPMHMSFAC